MVFESLKRPAIWSSLVAAFAFCLPAIGPAAAATYGQPTALTVTPTFAASTDANAPSGTLTGVIEVARNHRVRQTRRLRRRARRGRRRYYRRRRNFDGASAVVGGIIGLAAGAIAAGALANRPPTVVYEGPPAPYSGEWYRRCSRKYRSFRASDGTFLGYDGIRRRCRLP